VALKLGFGLNPEKTGDSKPGTAPVSHEVRLLAAAAGYAKHFGVEISGWPPDAKWRS